MSKTSLGKLTGLERFASSFSADYRFGPLNVMILLAICLLTMAVHLLVFPFQLKVVISMVGVGLGLAMILRVSQVWEATLVCTTLAALLVYLRHRPESWILVTGVVLAGLVAPGIQIAYQWEKAVILRFGGFRCLRGSGLFVLLPVVDKVANYVDQRIRVSDFARTAIGPPS